MQNGKMLHIIVGTVVLIVLAGALAFGQGNLKVSGNVGGTGWFNVTGNVDNSGAAAPITINPVVNLNGTGGGTQTVGITGRPSIAFKSLRSVNTRAKQVNVFTSADSLILNMTGGSWSLNGMRLTVNDSIANGGTVNPFFASGNVVYAKGAGHQTILGNVVYDSLSLSGSASFSLQNAATADSVFHSGGALTISNDLTVNRYGSFAAISDVLNTHNLNLGSNAATIAALSDNHGSVVAGTGILTVTGLGNNHGVITAATNGGAMTFANAATNNGNIVGGAGLVTFGNTLAHDGGTITGGPGSVLFSGAVTAANSALIDAPNAADSLRFADVLALNGTSMLRMNNGKARFDGNVTLASSNLLLGAASWAYFNGNAAQAVPADTFGNVYITNAASHALAGSVVVAGNLDIDSNLVTGANSITLASTDSLNVHGLAEVRGNVRRVLGATVANSRYRFNRADVYMAFTGATAADVTLGMSPATTPTNNSSTKYINRDYTFTGTTVPGNIQSVQLHYAATEVVNANEARLGVRAYSGGSWHKMISAGYTRTSGSGIVTVSGLAYSPAGVTELSMAQAGLIAVANADWATPTTWDEGYVPINTDDVEIPNGMTVAVSSGSQTAESVTFSGTSALNLTGGSLTVTGDMATVAGTTVTQANGASLTLAQTSGAVGGFGTFSLSGTTTVGTATYAGNMTIDNLTVNATGSLHVFGDLTVNTNLTNNGVVTVGQ